MKVSSSPAAPSDNSTNATAAAAPSLSFPTEVCAAISAAINASASATDKVCDESHILEAWAQGGSFAATAATLYGMTDQVREKRVSKIQGNQVWNSLFFKK